MIDVVNLFEPYYCVYVNNSPSQLHLRSSPSAFRKIFNAYNLPFPPSWPLNRASQTLAKVPVRRDSLA
jgi:hypothetical protein